VEYTPEQFLRLVDEIESQGGEYLEDEVCKPRQITFTGSYFGPMWVHGCGNDTLFTFPYASEAAGSLHDVRLCAVCDNLGLRPRFMAAVLG
jgi:hypothetical protein